MTNDDTYTSERLRDMAREIEESSKAHQAAAVILERLSNRLDDHDRRIQTLERTPESWLHTVSTSGGCLSSMVFAAISGVGVLISLSALVVAIFHL